MKIDLHIHLEHRPIEYAYTALIKAKEFGVDGGVMFEHNRNEPPKWWQTLLKRTPIPVFWGCEYSSRDGHLLIITADTKFPCRELFRPMQEIIDQVVSIGGAAIPAHPFTRMHSAPLGNKVYDLKNITALETINGALDRELNLKAEEARSRLGIPGVGGSDAHNPFMTARAYTLFKNKIATQQELVNELKKGAYTGEYAPTYRV